METRLSSRPSSCCRAVASRAVASCALCLAACLLGMVLIGVLFPCRAWPQGLLESSEPPPTRLISPSDSWARMMGDDGGGGGAEDWRFVNADGGAVEALRFDDESRDDWSVAYPMERDFAVSGQVSGRRTLWQRIKADHAFYYDLHSFKMLAGGFLVGAAIANTQLDQGIQDHFQVSVRGASSDDWFESLHSSKELGNGRYSLPVFAAAWAAGAFFDESPALATTGRWGERSLRTFLVGAPSLMVAQRLTGGSRPGEKDRNSRWLPFQDNNGVSGHAFISAFPFINAAKMTDRPILKSAFYAGSLLGPLSRVNDDDHYPSQVALGWWMAYVATTAIDRTEKANDNLVLYPYMADNGAAGGMFEWRF
ncbi:phosphatase PAP2 family protein [Neorhodopirellula lusitana]|uniref:hypothetical protein n=1 Tax=Neorhodopirellula lusitana TaxID=445327 RepID=UPI00384FEE1A